jgi:hypothetical protein
MEVITDQEVRQWIAKNRIYDGLKLRETSLFYENNEADCIELKFPETPLRVTYFTRLVSMLNLDDEALFPGALLWITVYDIGSPPLEKTGWRLIERMRQGFGENRPLQTASGHFFRSDELVELNAFLLPCFVFAWDAYVVPFSASDFFVHISHDEFWVVVTRTQETYDNYSEN